MIEYKNIKSIKNTKNINHINNMNTIVTVVVLGIVFVSLTMASWLLPPQEFSDRQRTAKAYTAPEVFPGYHVRWKLYDGI